MDFVALDVETANYDNASICQIGLAFFSDGKLIDTWQSYVNPEDDFEPSFLKIHGIRKSDVREAPKFPEIHTELEEKLSGKVVVIHTWFDKTALTKAARKSNLRLFKCKWLDSSSVARQTWTQFSNSGYNLANLSKHLDIKFKHHNALEDARAAGEVLLCAIVESGITLDEWINRGKGQGQSRVSRKKVDVFIVYPGDNISKAIKLLRSILSIGLFKAQILAGEPSVVENISPTTANKITKGIVGNGGTVEQYAHGEKSIEDIEISSDVLAKIQHQATNKKRNNLITAVIVVLFILACIITCIGLIVIN